MFRHLELVINIIIIRLPDWKGRLAYTPPPGPMSLLAQTDDTEIEDIFKVFLSEMTWLFID